MNKLPIAFALFSFEGSKIKKQILEEIAAFSFNNGLAYNKAQLLEELQAREKVGNTMIAESFALPHIESPVIRESGVVLVRSKKGIFWQEAYQAKTILVILLKENETKIMKKGIVSLMRCLAYEENLQVITERSKEEVESFLFRQLHV